jgi:ubiquinone biosynthesis protein COQ9
MLLNTLNKCFRLASQNSLLYIKPASNMRRLLSSTATSNDDPKEHQQQSKSFSEDSIKNKILESSLRFVPQFGFTTDAIEQGKL